jgi:HK97 family phage major capsid protein
MSTIAELRKRRSEIYAQAQAAQEMATTEKRELSDDELADVEGFLSQVEELDGQIKAMSSREQTEARLRKLKSDWQAPAGRKTDADPVDPQATNPVRGGKDRIADDPQFGFKAPRDFFLAVIEAGREGGAVAPGLKFLAAAGADEQGGYSDPYGGFFIPKAFVPGPLQVAAEPDPTAGRTRMIPMGAPTVHFNARVDKVHTTSVSGGLTVARRAETAAITSSRMEFEQVTLQATALFGFYFATEELLIDSPVSIAAIIEAGFRDQFTAHLLDERLNGTGTGQYTGINTTANLARVSVVKETGQLANTINYQNIVKMRARAWGYGGAVWMANHDTYTQLAQLQLALGTAGAIVWQPSAVTDRPDMLLGRPLFFTEFCKTLGTQGDVILANWGEFLEGMYQPMQSAESIHVRFDRHERAFKFWMRNAGAPWWRAALTPKNGANTLSPFVVLDTRA